MFSKTFLQTYNYHQSYRSMLDLYQMELEMFSYNPRSLLGSNTPGKHLVTLVMKATMLTMVILTLQIF